MMKHCSTCKETKPTTSFYGDRTKKDGFCFQCKDCEKERHKGYYQANKDKFVEYTRKYRANNKDKINRYKREYYQTNKDKFAEYRQANKDIIAEYSREYYRQNKDKFAEYRREYYRQNKDKVAENSREYYRQNKDKVAENRRERYQQNKDKINERKREYSRNNREKINEWKRNYFQERYQNNIQVRLASIFRARIYRVLKDIAKPAATMDLIGCTIKELKEHLETQFTDGMSWNNHSLKGWHIDHIVPCNAFDLTDPEQQKLCFHYSNLQPLWAEDNLSKNAKYGEG